MIEKGKIKTVDVDLFSQCNKKKGGGTKWHAGLNMVQKMHILDAMDNKDAVNNPDFNLANKIDKEELKTLKQEAREYKHKMKQRFK